VWPQTLKWAETVASTSDQYLKMQTDAATALVNRPKTTQEWYTVVGKAFGGAYNPEVWDATRRALTINGAPQELLDMVGAQWSAQGQQRAAALATGTAQGEVSLQKDEVMVPDGKGGTKTVLANFNPKVATGNYTDPNTGQVLTGVTPIPKGASQGTPSPDIPPPNATQDIDLTAFDKVKDPEVVKRSKMLLTYDIGVQARNWNDQRWVDAAGLAMAVDPRWSQDEFPNRQKLKSSFKSGTDSTNLGRARTAIDHFMSFNENGKKLDNSTIVEFNKGKNWANIKLLGDPAVRAMRMDINALSSELASLWKGLQASGTDVETAEWRATLDLADSPAALYAAFKEGLHLLAARVDATRWKYEQGMGGDKYTKQLLDPRRRAYLEKEGLEEIADQIDPDYTQPASSSQRAVAPPKVGAGTPEMFSATTTAASEWGPAGTLVNFPSMATRDAAAKETGGLLKVEAKTISAKKPATGAKPPANPALDDEWESPMGVLKWNGTIWR
jgi:hypothetical protein